MRKVDGIIINFFGRRWALNVVIAEQSDGDVGVSAKVDHGISKAPASMIIPRDKAKELYEALGVALLR